MAYVAEFVWDDGNLDHIEDDNGVPFEDVEVAISKAEDAPSGRRIGCS